MGKKALINVSIGASTLKIIHTEIQDTDIIFKNSVLLETNSNLYLNKENLNFDFIEDKIRGFLFENKIKNGIISYTLPDYIITNTVVNKQQLMTPEYLSSLLKGKIYEEILDEHLDNETFTLDCQVTNTTKFGNDNDGDGTTDMVVSYVDNDIVTNLKRMSKRLKMKVGVLESETASLLRLIDMFEIKENYLIIDIGEVFTKTIFVCGTNSLEYSITPKGVYRIDGLISSLYKQPLNIAKTIRKQQGILTKTEASSKMIEPIIHDMFSLSILEQLDYIRNTYNGLYFVNKFLITGGAWMVPGIKEILKKQSLDQFGDDYEFEDFGQYCKNLNFENEFVQTDVLDNILLYGTAVGLSLRGGI